MPKLRQHTIVPTAEENAQINVGISKDPNNQKWTQADFAQAKSANTHFSPAIYQHLVALKRPVGRPRSDKTKILTAIRLDPDLIEAFKTTGKGWQTRINHALREYIKEHHINR